MIRARGAVRGTSTQITGITKFTVRNRLTYSRGRSDTDIGPTSADMNGIETTVTLECDSDAEITALSNQTAEQLVVKYSVQGGTARKRTFDSVQFGPIQRVSIPQNPGQGNTVRYQMTGRGVFVAADDEFGDHQAVANDT